LKGQAIRLICPKGMSVSAMESSVVAIGSDIVVSRAFRVRAAANLRVSH
jgi:hypothetical protein